MVIIIFEMHCMYLAFVKNYCLCVADLRAYFVVDKNNFLVKEKTIRKMIVCGDNIKGLYLLPKSHATTTLVGVCTNAMVRQHRLGHPSQAALSQVLNVVPVSGSHKVLSCSTCATNKAQCWPFQSCTFTS